MVSKQLLRKLWMCIHRGEEILFDYKTIRGYVLKDRRTKPIDIDERMTLFGLDFDIGYENTYKIAFMSNIRFIRSSAVYITDQYDSQISTLKKGKVRKQKSDLLSSRVSQ